MKVNKRLALGASVVATVAFAAPSFAGNQTSHGSGTSQPMHCRDSNGNPMDATIVYTPLSIWPPNHALVPFTITYSDTDGDNDMASLTITAITQNQVDDAGNELNGAGNTPNDWDYDPTTHTISDDGSNADTTTITGHVRAERSGKAGDRVYSIHVACTEYNGTDMSDMAENGPAATAQMGTATLTITVPHDQGKN